MSTFYPPLPLGAFARPRLKSSALVTNLPVLVWRARA